MKQEDMRRFRHEFKYLISAAQVPMIKNRILHLLPADPNAGEKGNYNIRSLYFDDYADRCYYENENGTDPREKFRIRIYNHSSERITLELKQKERGMTHKASCPLTEAQARMLMAGKILPDIASQHPLLQKLSAQMLSRRLRPVVIVEYERTPFIYENGNVRVTLDMNISASRAVGSFLDESIPRRPVMAAGQHLLEVKYDAYLPDFIYRNLQLESLTHTAYSKYYICRKFTR